MGEQVKNEDYKSDGQYKVSHRNADRINHLQEYAFMETLGFHAK